MHAAHLANTSDARRTLFFLGLAQRSGGDSVLAKEHAATLPQISRLF